MIVKPQLKKYSLQLSMERHQWQCIPDRRWQAVPCTYRSHREGTVAEHWASGGRYHEHGCVSRAKTTSNVDVRYLEKALSEVHRRCSTKAAVGQIAQPECDSLKNSQPLSWQSNGIVLISDWDDAWCKKVTRKCTRLPQMDEGEVYVYWTVTNFYQLHIH